MTKTEKLERFSNGFSMNNLSIFANLGKMFCNHFKFYRKHHPKSVTGNIFVNICSRMDILDMEFVGTVIVNSFKHLYVNNVLSGAIQSFSLLLDMTSNSKSGI